LFCRAKCDILSSSIVLILGEIPLKDRLQGKFIVLDGPDGCGKSTQVWLLVKWLEGQGVPTSSFRDPGDTDIGEKIREILLNPQHLAMDTRTELLLYMAARAQLWAEKIAPALKAKHCVVLDRWLSSTCAYQGSAGGFGIDKVIRIATDCLERVWPDLTIILDIDLKTAAGRLKRQLDRMEAKGDGYHKKVREGFLKLAREHKNFVVIDGTDDIETVHRRVLEIIEKSPEHLPVTSMRDMEKQAIIAALANTQGNREKAAKLLGIGERTLYRKISKYNL
jgi:dTMP kinase